MKAAASLYGVNMVTDKPDSPHRIARPDQGRALLNFAEIDPAVPATVVPELEAAMKKAGTKYRMETFTGTHHGFCFAARADYHAAAAEESWSRAARSVGPQPASERAAHAMSGASDPRVGRRDLLRGPRQRLSGAAVRAGIPELAHRALAHQSRAARRPAGLAGSDRGAVGPFPR